MKISLEFFRNFEFINVFEYKMAFIKIINFFIMFLENFLTENNED